MVKFKKETQQLNMVRRGAHAFLVSTKGKGSGGIGYNDITTNRVSLQLLPPSLSRLLVGDNDVISDGEDDASCIFTSFSLLLPSPAPLNRALSLLAHVTLCVVFSETRHNILIFFRIVVIVDRPPFGV
jgi:hypothetical protein